MNWDDVYQYNRRYINQRVRRHVPDREFLYQRVERVFEMYGDVVCPKTQKVFFNAEARKKADNVLETIARGEVSDLPDIQLYTILRMDGDGLPIYRCSRGTNDVEGGIHQKLTAKFGPGIMSIEKADAVLAEERHRHNYRQQVLHNGVYDIGCYDTWLMDDCVELAAELWPGKELVPNWPSCNDMIDTGEQFGIGPIGLSLPEEHAEAFAAIAKEANMSRDMKFYAKRTEVAIPFLPISHADERKLFNQLAKECVGRSAVNFTLMAEKWNTPTYVNARTVFPKTSSMLEQHYKRGCKVLLTRQATSDKREDIDELLSRLRQPGDATLFPPPREISRAPTPIATAPRAEPFVVGAPALANYVAPAPQLVSMTATPNSAATQSTTQASPPQPRKRGKKRRPTSISIGTFNTNPPPQPRPAAFPQGQVPLRPAPFAPSMSSNPGLPTSTASARPRMPFYPPFPRSNTTSFPPGMQGPPRPGNRNA